jgi:hypothetical protein
MAVMRPNRPLLALVLLPLSLRCVAQQVYTTQDYKNAERWMSYNLTGLVQHTVSGVTYLPDGRISFNDGKLARIADPAKLTIIDAPKPEAPKAPAAAQEGRCREPLAGQEARGVHPRQQPLAQDRRYGRREAAHHGRHHRLRLRDRQRRLAALGRGRAHLVG